MTLDVQVTYRLTLSNTEWDRLAAMVAHYAATGPDEQAGDVALYDLFDVETTADDEPPDDDPADDFAEALRDAEAADPFAKAPVPASRRRVGLLKRLTG